jgi:hypothetical protein
VLADPHRVRVNIQLIDAIRQQHCGVGRYSHGRGGAKGKSGSFSEPHYAM